MKTCKRTFTMLMGMFIFVLSFVLLGNISADAASDEGYFTHVAYGSGIKITSYSGAEDALIIPSRIGNKDVKAIGSNIVKNKTDVKSVEIPDTVNTIDNEAFKDCIGLTKANVGKNVSHIGDGAFSGCTSLSYAYLGSSLNSIGANAFNNCTALSTVNLPLSLRTIGNNAFNNCSALNSVTIPSNVEKVGSNTYRNCKYLNTVVISNGVKTIDAYAFADCIRLKNITIPTSVTSIAANSFNNINADAVFHVLSGTYADRYITERNKTEANPSKIIPISRIPVSSLSFSYGTASITKYVGQQENLAAHLNIVPGNSTDMINWKSFDTNKVTIDNFGLLTAKAVSSAVTIKAIANNGSADVKNVSLCVKVLPAPTSITLTEKGKTAAASTKQLEVGKVLSLASTLQPSASKGAPITYTPSNPAIATVDSNGVVKGIGEGTVVITARTYNGKSASYQIQVYKNRTSLTGWTLKEITLVAGKTYTFQGLTGMSFKTNKSSIATVSSTGVVKAKKAGTAEITIYNNTSQAKCKVIVKAKPSKGKITSAKVSGKKVTLKWKKQSGISGYKVYYKAKGESSYKAIAANRSVNQTSYKFTTLKKKTTYYFKVRNYVKIGSTYYYGSYSSVKKVTTK